MLPPSAAAKLGRADQHINDLNGFVGAFLNERPFKIVRRYNPDSGKLTLSVKTEKPIPDTISLILGDAIHNLRAVLDHTYFAIISPRTERRDNIQFPIYRPDNKKDVLGRRLIKLATEEVAAAIDKCEPEPGGRYKLHELDAIDIEDKHRLLLLTGRAGDLPVNLVKLLLPEMHGTMSGLGTLRFIGQGDDMFSVQLSPTHPTAKRGAFEDEIKLMTNFALVFGRTTPFKHREVIPLLVELRNSVEAAAASVWAAANI